MYKYLPRILPLKHFSVLREPNAIIGFHAGLSAIHNRLKILISHKCPFVDHFLIFGWKLFIQKRSYLLNECRGNRDSHILIGVFSVGQLSFGEKATRIHQNNILHFEPICIILLFPMKTEFISLANYLKCFTIFTKRVGLLTFLFKRLKKIRY